MQLTKNDTESFENVRRAVECSIHTPFRIRDLMKQSGMCESKLHYGFKFLYQTSIYQYHLQIRMEYARALLEDGLQVKEVAIRLGYSTTGSFSRAFMKVFRHPPVFYKKQNVVSVN